MFCNKCGRKVEEESKFCSSCGAVIDSQNNRIESNSPNMNDNSSATSSTQTMNSEPRFNNNYDNIIHPNMTKYAIACVAIPTISIIIYWYVGIPVYVAVLLASLGYGCAKKGKDGNKTLSVIGYILNTILLLICIIMFFAIIIEKSM